MWYMIMCGLHVITEMSAVFKCLNKYSKYYFILLFGKIVTNSTDPLFKLFIYFAIYTCGRKYPKLWPNPKLSRKSKFRPKLFGQHYGFLARIMKYKSREFG